MGAGRLGRDAELPRRSRRWSCPRRRAGRPRTRGPSAAATAHRRRRGRGPSGPGRRPGRPGPAIPGALPDPEPHWRARAPSANGFERTWHAARSSRAQAASHVRPWRSQPATAASRARRAMPVAPSASGDEAVARGRAPPPRHRGCSRAGRDRRPASSRPRPAGPSPERRAPRYDERGQVHAFADGPSPVPWRPRHRVSASSASPARRATSAQAPPRAGG